MKRAGKAIVIAAAAVSIVALGATLYILRRFGGDS